MKCPNCGNENPPDYMFCDECGARLQGEEGVVATQAVDVPNNGAGGEAGIAAGSMDMGGQPPQGAAAEPAYPTYDAPTAQYGSGGDESSAGADEQPQYGAQPGYSEPHSVAGGADEAAGLAVPLTEDTVQTYGGGEAQEGEDSGAGAYTPSLEAADQDDQSMPGVVPIEEGPSGQWEEEETTDNTVFAPAGAALGAAGMYDGQAPSSTAGEGQGEFAGEALRLLTSAQQALASDDWAGFGQKLADLRTYLSGLAGGTPSTMQSSQPAYSETVNAQPVRQPQPSYIEQVGEIEESSPQTAEPNAEAGYLGAEPEQSYPSYSPEGETQESTGEATSDTPVSVGSAAPTNGATESAMARLVIISSGAELPLPDQEEITVGREDPSSGIFPEVDLTPYGGEEGGVSRRHARLLHINGDYFVEDLQATNFTKLDGQRLTAHTRERLEDGARIDFGRVATIFRRS